MDQKRETNFKTSEEVLSALIAKLKASKGELQAAMEKFQTIHALPPTTTSTGTKVIVDPPASRNRTIKFKEIVFTACLSDETVEFFEDDRHVTRDELRLLEVAHPKEYAKIKQAWITAWKELQALNAFEND